MYNGKSSGQGPVRVGGWYIKPMYLYIGAAILAVAAIFLIMRFLSTSLAMHFGAFAGILLLVGNLRELIGQSYGDRGSTALLNVLVGGGLIFAWLSQFFGVLLWVPALILVGIATPLIFGRSSVYRGYLTAARSAVDTVKRTVVR
ncbi:hypothetical protein [Candidatus Chloroploca sp. Khr17]|uniref:hypothetical protein n=1 Tax=Candidatus Chloroploca sp. Khr17 TaxID=2496869 RepID=UPI00101D0C3E|nr:hypothetical protein [Candidatus Chloroploca sp. Khr17]